MIEVSAFKYVPPFVQGHVRDLRVRWALEEAGLPYRAKLLDFTELKSADYRKLQPFNQVPSFAENGKVLFESGAIVLHIAERSETLMPKDADGRALATTWVFAAMNSIEPYVDRLGEIDGFHANDEWAKLRRPQVVEMVSKRLGQLADYMAGRDYLIDRFSAADILMTCVLREVPADILGQHPQLAAYRRRCEGRPAFKKALDDHMAPFKAYAPAH